MPTYPDATPPCMRTLSDHEALVARLLKDYRYTDHPFIWTPTRTLYAHYLQERAVALSGPQNAPTDSLADQARRYPALTLGQFGSMASRLFPEYPRVNRWLSGRQLRGLGGLWGPNSAACRGWRDYPAKLCRFPLPSDWIPSRSLPMVYGADDGPLGE